MFESETPYPIGVRVGGKTESHSVMKLTVIPG